MHPRDALITHYTRLQIVDAQVNLIGRMGQWPCRILFRL